MAGGVAVAAAALLFGVLAGAQQTPATPAPPPSGGGVSGQTPTPGSGGGQTGSGGVRSTTNIIGGQGTGPQGGQGGPGAGGQPSSTTGAGTGGPEPISGRAMGPMGPRSISGQSRGVSTLGTSGQYEPYLERKIIYRDDEVPQGGEMLTLTTQEGAMGAIEFLDALYLATDWNILVTPEVEPISMRFWILEVTPQEALEILKFNGIYYEYNPETNFVYFMTKEEYLRRQFAGVDKEIFEVDYIDLVDAESVLQSLASPNARIIADPRTARLFVWDTEDNREAMRETLEALDMPVEPERYELTHVNAEEVVDSLFDLLSERGVAFSDPRTNTIIVEDLPYRQERIGEFLTTLDVAFETRTWTLNYLEPSEMASRIEDLVPDGMGTIVEDEEVRQITVSTLPEWIEKIGERVELWDVPKRQVELEAYVVAASQDFVRQFGIDWAYIDERDGEIISFATGSRFPSATRVPEQGQLLQIGAAPFQVPLRDSLTGNPVTDINGNVIPDPEVEQGGISTVLNWLDDRGDVRILTSARIVVQDGESATIRNTTDEPYQEGGVGTFNNTTGGGGNVFSRNVVPLRVQFVTVGTVLQVEPIINELDNIILDIEAEDSSAEFVTITSGDLNSTVPSKTESRAQTRVMVSDRQTIVIGGLRNSSLQDDVEKVPVLGDLPFLGRLFKNTNLDQRQSDLLIFITPTIVDEYTQPEAAQLAQFEAETYRDLEHNKKPLLRRLQSDLARGKNELHITVGQAGNLFVEGEPTDLEDAVELIGTLRPSTTVRVRFHDRAPREVVEVLEDAATIAGLKYEVLTGMNQTGFVPTPRPSDEREGFVLQPAPGAPGAAEGGVLEGGVLIVPDEDLQEEEAPADDE